jgi:hypothetical protein
MQLKKCMNIIMEKEDSAKISNGRELWLFYRWRRA